MSTEQNRSGDAPRKSGPGRWQPDFSDVPTLNRRRRWRPLDLPRHAIVHVRVEPRRAVIQFVNEARPRSDRRSRPPRVTGDTWTGMPLRAGEVIAAVYAPDGTLLDVQAGPKRRTLYTDVRNPKQPVAYAGSPFVPKVDDRSFHLSIPEHAGYLIFLRTEIMPRSGADRDRDPPRNWLFGESPLGKPRGLRIVPLSVYFLDGLRDQPTEFPPFQWPFPDIRALLHLLREFLEFLEDFMESLVPPLVIPDCGSKEAPVWLHQGSDVDEETGFNIVITGDGFSTADLSGETAALDQERFDLTAGMIARYLFDNDPFLHTGTPFSENRERINIAKVRAISENTGITNCPEEGVKRCTFFGTQGHFTYDDTCSGPASYIGSLLSWKIRNAASPALPPDRVHLVIVVCNCEAEGGSADPENGIVYLPLGQLASKTAANWWDPAASRPAYDFMVYLFHEVGHAIADLSEEDIRCLPWDGRKHPNLVHIPDVETPPADPWTENLGEYSPVAGVEEYRFLPEEAECNPEASPCADPECFCAHNTGISTMADYEELAELFPKVGLYWGCLYMDSDEIVGGSTCDEASGCNDMADPRGRHFFRAQALCGMRFLGLPYCAVCAAAIRREILNPV